ncbi:hypothetical protein K435DRAFT_833023 [Dendrothele bispora CBS 962.96]|uniref:F-box domain-containing protein n=1 Tax=Dendrothele bispora (strain CBS 962.96) TaxID=1314807 RepID=A0A4S8MZH5_DENBC|nr:hypothetical protein K435DRAFT_833023 [Dendrothele bispora CBS 962.96]
MVGLLQLPNELLFVILQELDILSFLRCMQVCQALHSTVGSSSLLQYRKYLVLFGMKDGPPGTEGTFTRLDKLKTYQDSWHDFNWSSKQTFPLRDVQLWELAGGILAFTYPKTLFTFIQLPSVHRGIEQKEWYVEVDSKLDVADFSMDISNDLLVLLVKGDDDTGEGTLFKVHLLSLSTGKPHPDALSPVLDFRHDEVDNEWTYETRIFGQHFAVMFSMDDKLVIWNWQNGDFLQERNCILSFTFLTESLVLISQIRGTVQHGSSLELIIVDINDNKESRCTLELPEPHGLFDLSIHSESFCRRSDDVPFSTSLDDRLIVIFYTLFDSHPEDEAVYVLFVPLSTILSVLEQENDYHTWESWGPKGSRMLQHNCHADVWPWVCYVHGLKAALYDKDTKEVRILDFNQPALKYDLAKRERPGLDYLTEESVITGAFMESVHTSLGVRVRTGKLPVDPTTAVMFSEDSLLVVCHGDESDSEQEEMVVFSF